MSEYTPSAYVLVQAYALQGTDGMAKDRADAQRAIAKIKADAWDEGFAEFERGHHASNYEPWEYTEDNPYRTR